MSDRIKPLLYAIADALEISPTLQYENDIPFTGSRKGVLELFEGYSPTIISGIEDSLIDTLNEVVAAQVHIFGNVGAVIVVDGKKGDTHAYIYDRSKTPENSDCTPWDIGFWSRKRLYYWLGKSCKAVYHHSLWDDDWIKLESGAQKLREYNAVRDAGGKSSKAYKQMWDVSPEEGS